MSSTSTLTREQRIVPSIRRMAARLGVNPDLISGSAEGGRVLRSDVQAAADARRTQPAARAAEPAPAPNPFPGVSHVPTRQDGPFPGVVAKDLAGNRGGLPVYDPGPLASDSWFPTHNAVLASPATNTAAEKDAGPRYTDGWFPGMPIVLATDA